MSKTQFSSLEQRGTGRFPLSPLTPTAIEIAPNAHQITSRYLPDPTQAFTKSDSQPLPLQFAKQAQETPNAVAIVTNSQIWTYAEVYLLALAVTKLLHRNGVKDGDIIGILAQREPTLIWAILGIWYSKARFVILNPAYPIAYLERLCQKVQPCHILRHQSVSPIPELTHTIPETILRVNQPSDIQDINLQHEVSGADGAYIAFTSGTTGQSHGVVGTHAPLSHFVEWQTERFGLTSNDRFSLLSGLAHDPLMRDIFTPLCIGATLCIPSAEQMADGEALATWVKDQGITAMHTTPALATLLIEGFARQVTTGHTLRHIFFGGERLTANIIERLRPFTPQAQFANFYGATETPQAVAYHIVSGQSVNDPVPIGQGINNVQLLVVKDAQLAGVGEEGEICVRTPYLAEGYWQEVEQTAQKFVLNPWGNSPADYMYRTGDIGYYLENGSVVLIGRRDTQVNIRGHRIDPKMVDMAMGLHTAVETAVTLALPHAQTGDYQLVTFAIKQSTDKSLDVATELHVHAAQHLPNYLRPSRIIFVDQIPLTPNGKTHYTKLAEIAQQTTQRAFSPAPSTELEKAIAALWQSLLDAEIVGREDDFFALGGHSLLGLQLISRLKQQLNIALPAHFVFNHRTVAKQAAYVEHSAVEEAVMPIQVEEENGRFSPLSSYQKRVWLLSQFSDEASVAYNLPWAIDLRGPLDVRTLEQSLIHLMARHEILRSRYDLVDGEPQQIVDRTLDRGVTPHVLMASLETMITETEGAWNDIIKTAISTPFDLAQEPPIRLQLIQFAADWHQLLFVVHHIAFDGWSSGIFIAELGKIYSAIVNGQTPELTPLPIQYADFARWETSHAETYTPQLDYWQKQLGGNLAPLNLPTDFSRPAVQTYRGQTVQIQVPLNLTQKLHRLSQQENVTLYTTLLAVFNVLLHRYTSQIDLLVGTPIANRGHVDLEQLIGFFVNTLVLRTDLSDQPTFKQLLKHIRQVVEDGFTHQDVPLEKVVERIQPERSLSHNPLFQVLFALHNVPHQSFSFAGLDAARREVLANVAQFDLSLECVEQPDGLQATLYFNEDLFTRKTAVSLLHHFQNLLECIVQQPNQTISLLPLMDEQEKQDLLNLGANFGTVYPKHHCIHHQFSEQAARTPNKTAVSFESKSITYAELNRSANQLAHHLQKIGVTPDTCVGVYMNRSIDMVVGILAILKAGGAYLPLDPTYPAQRIVFMVEDAEVKIVLTQSLLADQIPTQGAQLVCLDADWAMIARERADEPKTAVSPANLSYLIYTSGSTGKPKGVMVEHRNAINLFAGMDEVVPYDSDPVWLSAASLSFDMSVPELLWTLTRGFHMVLLSDKSQTKAIGVTDTAYSFSALTEKHRVTHFQCTPTLASMLLMDEQHKAPFAQFDLLILGGEALPPALVAVLQGIMSGTLINMYGPTETTVWSSSYIVSEADSGVIPIGRPIANTQLLIVNKQNQFVPLGVPGELLIGGDGVTRGYWNRPNLTAEKFIDNPFGNGRLYRTNDLARFRPDGNVEFLGRADHQVKLRGHRIELGEIEARLDEHDAVSTAVAMVRGENNNQRLVAYIRADYPVTDINLRDHLRDRLPDYMIPTRFVFVDKFPRTPNNKIDRNALPDVETTIQKADDFIPPETETEELVAEIWSELLELEKIGRFTNFFQLGGHSLLATQIIARLNQLLDLNLSIFLIFESPTVAQLASKIEDILFAEFDEESAY